ncbi:MAG TPA: succinate dehydrogenase assembly factor 2 [Pseudomonadales bacterium]|nr:succinate dehydrogenase assembly factor 2 [Pseudomonadales bacterium]
MRSDKTSSKSNLSVNEPADASGENAPASNPERNRAYWRSRRGLLELDLLLPPFVVARYDALTRDEKRTLDALLDCEDQDVWDWMQQRSAPPHADLAALIDSIRLFNETRGP